MNDFAAIDFETANRHRGSVCSVGVVVVRERQVVEKVHELIRPRPNYYSSFTTSIHGMTCLDTDEAAEFPDVWSEIAPLVEGLPLVAHNSPFDEGCLRAAHEIFGMRYPEYRFFCTCRASRRAFPTLRNHKLNTVAQWVGHDLRNHHHALADAEACATIALHVF